MQTINLMNVLEREFGYNGSANCIRKPGRVSVSVISNPFPYTRIENTFTLPLDISECCITCK